MRSRHIAVYLLAMSSLLLSSAAIAQEERDTTEINVKIAPPAKLYTSLGLDGAIFSSAFMKRTGDDQELTTLRFTYFFHLGYDFNYDFSKHFGAWIGLGVKNIGFIEQQGDLTIKRRVYTLGIPIGLKFGNLRSKNYAFLGGGGDMPFNYREKEFLKRNRKEKFNEWFSDRTPAFMPYVFAGISIDPGITFKAQYYPTSFLNQDFTETQSGVPVKPYAAYDKVNLVMLVVGIDIHYHKRSDKKEISTKTTKTTVIM